MKVVRTETIQVHVSIWKNLLNKIKENKHIYRDNIVWAYHIWWAKPGIWLLKGRAGCWDCDGADVIGLVCMYCIGKACDEGVAWPGWLGLRGYGCIGWENCNCWLWLAGIPTFEEGIPCPTGWNCWEADWINCCPCCVGTTGRLIIDQKIETTKVTEDKQEKKLLEEMGMNQNFEDPRKQLEEAEMADR